jgi:hypothetical protein
MSSRGKSTVGTVELTLPKQPPRRVGDSSYATHQRYLSRWLTLPMLLIHPSLLRNATFHAQQSGGQNLRTFAAKHASRCKVGTHVGLRMHEQ